MEYENQYSTRPTGTGAERDMQALPSSRREVRLGTQGDKQVA